MNWPLKVQGRLLDPADVELIRCLMQEHPQWNRSRLSRELCTRWNWHRPDGQMKDMACRELLLKLERKGLITLPARQSKVANRRLPRIEPVDVDETQVTDALKALQPLELADARERKEGEKLFNFLLARYHYLGFQRPVGQNMKYLLRANDGRVLGCLLFGAAAWKCQARDRFIAWQPDSRERNLQRLTNNTRFLILPHVSVKCLASCALGMTMRRIRADWRARYGTELLAVETFVDRSRFAGTCYRAANFQCLGQTTGRTRQDRHHRLQTARKDVYIYPLITHFRRELCAE